MLASARLSCTSYDGKLVSYRKVTIVNSSSISSGDDGCSIVVVEKELELSCL